MTFIAQVIQDIQDSESGGRLTALDGVTGLSGDKLVGFLQRCAISASKDRDAVYLEIGVFQGLTLSSVAAAASNLTCFGVDDFSQFDSDGKNRSIVQERLGMHCQDNAELINSDFEEALLGLGGKLKGKRVAVYFVDGPHDYRSQYLCLEFVKPHLASNVVIVVDDSNYEHVRRANCDWLKANPNFSLLYDAYTPAHPGNLKGVELKSSREGWWNGINIIIRDDEHTLSRMYPSVSVSRERYFNDHVIHPHRYSESVPKLLSAAEAPLLKGIMKFLRARSQRPDAAKLYAAMNTYSDKLVSSRMAEFSNSE